jgi:hypothetical protein
MGERTDPATVIYGELVHWPLPTQQVVDDVVAALAAAGYRIVHDEQPATCPNGCADGLITVGDGDHGGAGCHEEHCPDPWHSAAAPPAPDDETEREVRELVAEIAPRVCGYCDGKGWYDDEGWTHYPYGKGSFRERTPHDGLLSCVCNDDEVYPEDITEPFMVTDRWTWEQQQRAALLLAAAYLGDGER